MGPKQNKLLLLVGSALWFIIVGVGIGVLSHYENTPGLPAVATPSEWPSDSRIPRSTELATLIMTVHPHCPCTRASLAELARLMTQAQGRLTAFVIFNKPPNVSRDWQHSDLWDTAAAIPGVNVMADEGIESRRFHAATSGQTILYSKEGTLLFSGGITGGRGHEGDNAGRSTIISFLSTGEADLTETPVFGCALFAREECQTGEEVGYPKHTN